MFYRQMLRISSTEHVSNEEFLRKIGTTRILRFTIRKKWFKFLGHLIRKDDLEYLTHTGYIEVKRGK